MNTLTCFRCLRYVMLNHSYHDQFDEQQGSWGAHADSTAIIGRRAFKSSWERKQEEGKQLRERSLPGFTNRMHRRKIAQTSADVVWLLKISMEKWAKLDIWSLSEITIFFNFIRVLHKERKGKLTLDALLMTFFLFRHFLTDFLGDNTKIHFGSSESDGC